MAGDKTYITDGQGKLHRATRVHAVTPTDIVWSSNPNDYTVQVKIDGKWHRAVLTMDAGSSTFFDNINIDKALVTGADGKQHTALIVKPESTVTLSDIKTDTHGTIAGTTTGETAVSTYSENWSDVKWQDNVNVYKVLVTGSDGKVHTALLTTSAGGGVQVIVLGPSPLLLPDAIANSLSYVKAFGGTEQNGTPTPDAPMDIVCNNGVLKWDSANQMVYADGTVETINAHSKNLLDMSAENIVLGRYINNSGAVVYSDSNFYNKKYIPVVAGGTYIWSTSSSISYFSVMEYDSDYVFTQRTLFSSAGTSGSITLRSDTAFVLIGSNMDSTRVTLDKIAAVDWQFEKGSSATDYTPYYNGGTATAEMLLKVGNYQDVQSILDGVVTRNVGIRVLDGTEDWEATSTAGLWLLRNVVATVLPSTCICTHFLGVSTTTTGENMPNLSMRYGVTGYGNRLYIRYQSLANVNELKQILAAQYAAGTPVIVIYPLATPTTESVAGQTLQVQDGDNVLEITQASLNGLELEAEYTKVA